MSHKNLNCSSLEKSFMSHKKVSLIFHKNLNCLNVSRKYLTKTSTVSISQVSKNFMSHKKVSLMFHKNLNCLNVSQKTSTVSMSQVSRKPHVSHKNLTIKLRKSWDICKISLSKNEMSHWVKYAIVQKCT